MLDVNTLTELGLSRPTATPAQSQSQGKLNQEAFLELMIAQFQNQDPFKPMENGDFLGQMAQFGTVSGIEELNQSFSTIAGSLYSDQALQASGLIDRTVLVSSDAGLLPGQGSLSGAVDLATSSGSLAVQVTDANGELVRRMDLGTQPSGLARHHSGSHWW